MVSKRNTVQRQLILNAVRDLDLHATAEQVYEHIHEKQPSISKATVYRNLSLMTESGELLNAGNFHGSTHYDHNCHEHYHFICDECKRIFDLNGDYSGIIGKTKETNDHDIKGCHISFTGVCHECKMK